MSSSTKMNGAAMPRASQARKAKETRTMPASHAQPGTARARSTTKLDLGQPLPELAGLGRARGDADVARRHQRPEPILADVGLADDAFRVEAQPLQAPLEVEAGRGGADEEQPRSGIRPAQARKRLEQLRDPLRGVDVAEAAEERLARD